MSTGFARDCVMRGAVAATSTGKILGVRVDVLADHGALNATAQPTNYPAGFFHVFTGSYDLEAAHCHVRGVYTNKAPGGVAYACSFRVAEGVYLVERMVDCLARELEIDPAELRLKNLIAAEQLPYHCKTGQSPARDQRPDAGPGPGPRDDVCTARVVASAMLEVAPEDLPWEKGPPARVAGARPSSGVRAQHFRRPGGFTR